MASDLTVQTIRGPDSGANANKVIVPTGHTLKGSVDASTGLIPASGQVVRTYYASKNPGFETSSSGFVNSGMNFNNVVVGSDENPLLYLHMTTRLTAGSFQHCSVGLTYDGSSSGRIASPDWGFGIYFADYSWNVYSISGLNLRTMRSNPFTVSGTFNFYVQVKTSGNTVMFGGEAGDASSGYGNMYATIQIVKA